MIFSICSGEHARAWETEEERERESLSNRKSLLREGKEWKFTVKSLFYSYCPFNDALFIHIETEHKTYNHIHHRVMEHKIHDVHD